MTSYAAAGCHFRQDAHRRMASVIARIRCAEERERGERARDHRAVNGEKLFMSVTSAECTELEYATERDGAKTDKGDTATRKRRRGFCTAHTSGARFFKRRSPYFLQIYLSAGNSSPD